MLELATPGLAGHAQPRRRARLRLQPPDPGHLEHGRCARHTDSRRSQNWKNATASAASPTTPTSPRSRSARCRTSPASPPTSSSRSPRRASASTPSSRTPANDNLTDLTFTLSREGPAQRRGAHARDLRSGRRGRLSSPMANLGKVSIVGVGIQTAPRLRRAHVPHPLRRRHQHRAHLDQRDPPDLHHRRQNASPTPCARSTTPSNWRRPNSLEGSPRPVYFRYDASPSHSPRPCPGGTGRSYPVDALDAARIRATTGLKLPDAVSIAAAKMAGAEAYVTNDRRQQRDGTGISVLVLDDLVRDAGAR